MTPAPRPASLLAKRLSKIDPNDLIPTGEHRLIDGYCPDCSGSCLVGFGNVVKEQEPDAEVQRIAAALHESGVIRGHRPPSATLTRAASALYSAGLRVATDCLLHDHTGPCIRAVG